MTRRIGATVLAAVLALAGACTDDERPATDEPPTTESAGPGTEIAEGLVVPDGARLAGLFRRPAPDPDPPDPRPPITVPAPGATRPTSTTTTTTTTTSPEPPEPQGPDDWTARLVVDRDPFGAFDDLAAQVRTTGPRVPGTAGACVWVHPAEGGGAAPFDAVASGPPEEGIDHLRCEASASDGEAAVTLTLQWGGPHPGTIDLTWAATTAAVASEGAAGPGPTTDPVDDAAAAVLPDAAEPDEPDAGDPFGGPVSCTPGGASLRLPRGATLVASEGGYDGWAVLASDDPEATIARLIELARAETGFGDLQTHPEEHLTLADGTVVVEQLWEINAGGGICTALTAPDGRHLLVTPQGD
ncbi:MAG TPA: hypothetical protein VGO60_03540 [Iamia sp.]|jgi:hypothetical protein|nr:hypothetical protein [Iamia sp.]